MENERGSADSLGKGEIVDFGAEEVAGFSGEKGLEAKSERGIEGGGEVAGQGMPGQATVMAADDGGPAATTVPSDVQGDLVNFTTQDGEKIEKVWVDKVKDVMKETKDNPRKREDDIFEVKKDFIKKRFGRTIGGGK